AVVEHVIGPPAARWSGRPLAELADVGAGDKAAPRADQDHRLHRRVGIPLVDRRDDAFGHTRRQRVDRWVIDGNDADPVRVFKTDQFTLAHVVSSGESVLYGSDEFI